MVYRDLSLQRKWHDDVSPINPYKASKNFGAGADGTVHVYYSQIGTEGNDYSIEVVTQDGANKEMSVALADNKLTVTLGKDALEDISVTSNTAKLIAEAIDALPEFEAEYTGTGATAYVTPFSEVAFSGGSYGTPCPTADVLVFVSPYYYWCDQAGSKNTVSWKRFTPATY